MAKSSFNEIVVGDYLSETQYYKVTGKDNNGISVVNERGFPFSINKAIVEEGIYTAKQFVEEIFVTRTQMIELFTQVGDTVFTVCYNKQPKAEDINNAIESANKGKILPIAELKSLVKSAYKGEERILTGYLILTETGFGRSMVIDLEADKGTNENHDGRIRQVDHRTLNWFICKGIKHSIKK